MGIPLWKGPSSRKSDAPRSTSPSRAGIRRRPTTRPHRRAHLPPAPPHGAPSSQTLFDLLRGEASLERSRISARLWHEMIAPGLPAPPRRALPLADYASMDALMRRTRPDDPPADETPDDAAAQWDLVTNELGFATACDELWDSEAEMDEHDGGADEGSDELTWELWDHRQAEESELERLRREEAEEAEREWVRRELARELGREPRRFEISERLADNTRRLLEELRERSRNVAIARARSLRSLRQQNRNA
ncbi:hypothetical protein EDC01DRAFT_631966 [Geopyxis carbonaria]|nr:hypothetical protein EDC01DRAFT_631966 [Geopyxis carbonaria]